MYSHKMCATDWALHEFSLLMEQSTFIVFIDFINLTVSYAGLPDGSQDKMPNDGRKMPKKCQKWVTREKNATFGK